MIDVDNEKLMPIIQQISRIFTENELTQLEAATVMAAFSATMHKEVLSLLVSNLMVIEMEKHGTIDKNEKT